MISVARLARALKALLIVMLSCCCLNVSATVLSSSAVSLAGDLQLLRDPDAAWSVQEVAQPGFAQRFEKLPGRPSQGYIQGAIWLRVTLERPPEMPELWWLEVAAPMFDDVFLYTPAAGGGFTERRAGTEWAFAGRDVNYRSPVFQVRLAAPETAYTFYLRIRTNNAVVLRLSAWTPQAFVAQFGREQLLFGLFLAVHLVVLLSSFWNFRASGEASYAYLAGFTLVSMCVTAAFEGLIFQYLLPTHPGWSEPIMLVFWVPVYPLYSLFLLDHLKISWQQGWGRFYVWGHWLVALLVLALSLGGAFQWVIPKFQAWTLVCMVLNLLVLIRHWLSSKTDAGALLLGSLPLSAGVAVRFGRNLGWLPATLSSDYLYMFGAILHLLVMSHAASQRYLVLRHAKEEAQALALELSHDAERKLEAQVLARTQALDQALSLARASLEIERQTHTDQRRFFATVSHELRTPLAVIDATALNLSLDSQAQDEATRRRYQKIQRASAQLITLVKNCFREDRFELLNRGLQRQPTDLEELLIDARESALMLSSRHQVLIQAQALPEDFPCDPELTLLTLRTLVGNAVKYTPPGTRVLLRARASAEGVTIEVLDNGPGVSAADLPQLFERYYRGQNATSVPGTGLGLPLARELIQMQGGSLTIESAPGQGFVATVWLPAGVAAPTPAPALA
ncbi:MAG: sensor histidine kinase [Polaromonas sp.]|nr:sensor histidine kinase [Polaromonas sp.]